MWKGKFSTESPRFGFAKPPPSGKGGFGLTGNDTRKIQRRENKGLLQNICFATGTFVYGIYLPQKALATSTMWGAVRPNCSSRAAAGPE